MSHFIASPRGIALPYSSLFNLNLRNQSKSLVKSRPPEYFWNQATRNPVPNTSPQDDATKPSSGLEEIALSEIEDEILQEQQIGNQNANKIPRFSRLRRIAFKAFVPKTDGTSDKKNIVRSVEVVCHQKFSNHLSHIEWINQENPPKKISIFNSWKYKSKGGSKIQVRKMVAVLKERISASSLLEKQPKTWGEYDRLYSDEQIDVINPPLPPMEPTAEAFRTRFYKAPEPSNEKVRQLVVNRLGILGDKPFDATDEGAAKANARTKIGDKLIEEGKAPSTLEQPWERPELITRDSRSTSTGQTRETIKDDQAGELSPKTLEQHPVFRKIVKQCREIFGTTFSMLSIIDDGRQVFLAESGLGGTREINRDIGFCAHTILSGRKGFTILDTHQDWRFENCPLTQNFDSRFYAGVPLMAPNLDGSEEAEVNSCPIGTLCVVDVKPRESFSLQDRKKLLYMSEYARREIGNWFAIKIEHKMNHLAVSLQAWKHEIERMANCTSDRDHPGGSKVSFSDRAARSSRASSPIQMISRLQSLGHNSISAAPNVSLKSFITKTCTGLLVGLDEPFESKTRSIFDFATRSVADTLDLSLVYLAAVAPDGEADGSGRTVIISGHNIPSPVPVCDAMLHLSALRTPEGGLLYQNPSLEEAREVGLQPRMPESEAFQSDGDPYASAMLLAVGVEAEPGLGGFVLAGYTDDRKRVFGGEDVAYMKWVASELSQYTSHIST